MKLRKGEWVIVLFNLLYILLFAIYYIYNKNYEFLWYVAVLVLFGVLIASTLNRSHFDYFVLWGLTIWGLLHMAGGGVHVNGDVLYALRLLPIFDGGGEFFILKFDQVVHFYGFAVVSVLALFVLKPHLKSKYNKLLVYFLIVSVSMGLGALNEIVEFIAVLVFPNTGVGGYYNTALDLVFNLLGALVGGAVAFIRYGR